MPNSFEAIPLVCIPVLNRGDLLKRCILSLDAPISNLLIINNGMDASVSRALSELMETRSGYISNFVIMCPEKNLGVSSSWNFGLRMMTQWGLNYAVMIGSDVEMKSGSLDLILQSFDAGIALRTYSLGYNLFMMTPLALNKVGYFDENIFPAYFEDNDYTRRLKLAGCFAPDVGGIQAVHGADGHDASLTIHSDPDYKAANNISYHKNREYYVKKWGGDVDRETFNHPFGDPNLPISYWHRDEQRIESLRWPQK